jgi:hypothetical protein
MILQRLRIVLYNRWKIAWKNFRADGLQTLSFAIIKIGGLRDLIRLRQEECQFIGTAI